MPTPNAFQRTMQRIARGLFGVTFGGPGAETWEEARRFDMGLSMYRSEGLEEPYRQHPAIAVAVSTIAEDAASVPWEIYPASADRDQDDALDEHPVLDLWQRPNEHMTGLQLWVGSYVSYLLFGETFWYYPDVVLGRGDRAPNAANSIRSGGGIVILDPRTVEHRVTGSGVEFRHRRGGEAVPLDMDRLTFFRRYNPYDPVRGLSKVEAVIAEAKGDYEAANWNERFFGTNNGMPTGLLMPAVGSMLTNDQRTEIHRTWSQRHGGTKRSVGILPAGWTFQDLGLSQRDMDFRALREYSREQILGMFGLPPFYAGVLDKANYANAREQKEVYWHGTIQRFLSEFQATINADFLPKIGVGDVGAWPNWEVVKALTENLSEKVQVAKELFALGFTKRQINERLELGFDVDELEDADVGYVPFSVVPVAFALEPPQPPPMMAPAEEGGEDEPGEEQRSRELDFPTRKALPAADVGTEQRRSVVWRAIISNTRDLERRFYSTTRGYFRRLRSELASELSGPKGWLISRALDDPQTLLAIVEAEGKRLKKAQSPNYKAAVVRGGESVLLETGIDISFDVNDPQVLAELGRLYNRSDLITDTVYRRIQKEIAESTAARETLRELADRIDEVLQGGLGRATVIARTEVGAAFNGGRYQSMKQAGFEETEWLSSRDPDVRDSHRIDGERTRVDGQFSNGLRYPNDPTGPPSEVINCRCVALPVTR